MFRYALLLVLSLSVVSAFSPARFARGNVQMKAETPSSAKVVGAAVIASTIFSGLPAFAVEGAGAKLGFFGFGDKEVASSPYSANENREDPLYSPYSAFGDGSAAVYKKGGKDEISFYSNTLTNSVERTKKIPAFIAKKQWNEVQTMLVRYNYNQREAMLRLAETAKDPKAANLAAKAYFQDINDINEYSLKKNGVKCQAAYDASVASLAKFQSML